MNDVVTLEEILSNLDNRYGFLYLGEDVYVRPKEAMLKDSDYKNDYDFNSHYCWLVFDNDKKVIGVDTLFDIYNVLVERGNISVIKKIFGYKEFLK